MRAAASFLVLLPLLVPGAAGAVELDPELRDAVARARAWRARGRPARAEATLEAMTRRRRADPRTWFALANLRMALGNREGATYAFHRAAGLGTQAMRDGLARRLREEGLPPFTDPVVLADLARARALAAALECRTRQRDWSSTTRACPVDGASLGRGAGACRLHPAREIPPLGDRRVARALLPELLQDPVSWRRAQAVRLAELDHLTGALLRGLRDEPAPDVRAAVLGRLTGRAGTLREDPLALEVARLYAGDASFEVRRDAWALLHLAGELPDVPPPDLVALVREADEGRTSERLVQDLWQARREAYRPAVVRSLVTPEHSGKALALRLLLLEDGDEGRRAAARALRIPNPALAAQLPTARQAMALVGAREGRSFGASPQEWLRALDAAR